MSKLLKYIFVAVLILLASCKTLKVSDGSMNKIASLSKKSLMDAIDKEQVAYRSAEVKKFTAEYSTSSEKKSFKGFLRYANDEKLMASVAPAMGIEIFRVLADRDTFGFIDRYNKQFYKGSYDFIKQRLGIDLGFSMLNFIVSGDVKQLPDLFQPKRDFTFSKKEAHLELSKTVMLKGNTFLIEYNYDSSFMLKRVYLKDFSTGDFIELMFMEYFEEGIYVFPKSLMISGNSGRKLVSLTLDYKSVEFNKQLNFPFSVSGKYSEILN